MVLNKQLQVRCESCFLCLCLLRQFQEINIQNMNVELVAQMFKNYQSNVLFHLEGMLVPPSIKLSFCANALDSNGQFERGFIRCEDWSRDIRTLGIRLYILQFC